MVGYRGGGCWAVVPFIFLVAGRRRECRSLNKAAASGDRRCRQIDWDWDWDKKEERV